MVEGRLAERLVALQRANDAQMQRPRGNRLGLMAHAVQVAELAHGYIAEECGGVGTSEGWREFWEKSCREAKERDARVLGGIQPPRSLEDGPYDLGRLLGASSVTLLGSTGQGAPGADGSALDYNAVFSSADDERLARYFCQQIIGSIPSQFLFDGAASEDEPADEDDRFALYYYDDDAVPAGAEDDAEGAFFSDSESARSDLSSFYEFEFELDGGGDAHGLSGSLAGVTLAGASPVNKDA